MATTHPHSPAPSGPPPLLKLLADDKRWNLVQALARSDRRVGELVALLAEPQNLVSYHLRQLREYRVVRERRSSADQRDVYYTLDLASLQHGLAAAAAGVHPGLVSDPDLPRLRTRLPEGCRVLFLCTHNSARSQMAEGLLRQMSGGKVEGHSAGTEVTRVHPLAIAAMESIGISLEGQRSKHLEDFLGQKFDYVITVCDRASEACPIFPGAPERIHWSIADPSVVEGTEREKLRAFQIALVDLRTRIGYFLNALANTSGPPA